MVYNKRYVRKSYSTNKRRYKKSYKKGVNIQKLVKREIYRQSETKYFDGSTTGFDILSTGTGRTNTALIPLNIPQGTSSTERIGNSIYLKGSKVKWTLKAPVSCSVRMLLLQINEQQSTDFTSVFDSLGVLGQLPRDINGFKYKVMFDRLYNMDPDNKGQITRSEYFKINKKLEYPSSSTVNPSNNQIYLYIFSDTTTTGVQLTSTCRSFFKDL